MAVDPNYNSIIFQDPLRSKPVRENFSDIESDIEDLQTQINNLTTPPGGNEVTNARDNFDVLRDNIRARRGHGDRITVASDFKITEQTVPDDTVQAAAGAGIIAGIGVYFASTTNSGSISASTAGKHRIVTIVITSGNVIQAISGTEVNIGTEAPFPVVSDTQMPLAWMDIDDTSPVVINNSDINDVRAFLIDPFNDFEYFDEEYTYNASNQISQIDVKDKKANTYTFTLNYTNQLITSIVITIDSITYTSTITYDSSNRITNQDLTLS